MDQLLSSSTAPDLAIAILLLAPLVIYAAVQGAGLLVVIIHALLISGFLFLIFPYQQEIAAFSPWAPFVLFIALVVLSGLVLYRSVGPGSASHKPLHIAIAASALTLLLISFSYHVVPIEQFYDFGASFDQFFGSVHNFFWITALAILALFVV